MKRKKHVIWEVDVYRPPKWLKKTVTFRTRKAAEEYTGSLDPMDCIWDLGAPRKRVVS